MSYAPTSPVEMDFAGQSRPFANRLLASHERAGSAKPFITVAIPHYRHRRYLEIVLKSIFEQQYADFEVVVSNDASPDDSDTSIPALLQESGCAFSYYSQPRNLGYDANVRFCLAAARGRYVFLLGNDDSLAGPDTLSDLAVGLQSLGLPEVAITNIESWASPGDVTRRAVSTRLLGGGVGAAVRFFRSFSFVSGLVFDRAVAMRHETGRWDQSIFYQIYLACRILAAGGRLGAVDVIAVRKDVQVDGQTVPNYVSRWKDAPVAFQPRHTGLDSVIRVTVDAVRPFVPKSKRSAITGRIIANVLLTAHPYWLLEYRRVANWSFALGVARGLWPGSLLREYDLKRADRVRLWALYCLVTPIALIMPISLFNKVKSRLAYTLRRLNQLR